MDFQSIRPRAIATVALLAVLVVGAATLRAAIGLERGGGGPLAQASAAGSMSLTNSNGEGAIFTLTNIAPGYTGEGQVTISNTGTMPGTLSLASADLSDAPGRLGGRLSERLQLRLEEIGSGTAAELYSGGLGVMPKLQLGTLTVGEARTYRFLITMLDGGAPSSPFVGDNLYQQARTNIGYEWTLTEIEGGNSEPEPPTSTPAIPHAAPPVTPSPPSENRTLFGTPHNDRLVGTPGDDVIYGRGGEDLIYGKGGRDLLIGGAGADRLYGGPGADRLRGGAGKDRSSGGSGADVISARGGGTDLVNCGSGRDVATVDRGDSVRACERVQGRS
jgi:hypothetical protein